MKRFWLVGCLLLASCSDGEKQALKTQNQALQTQIDTLKAQNAALTAERDALKTQLGTLQAQGAEARQVANATAARAYARNCATTIEMARADSTAGDPLSTFNGKSCEDPTLGGVLSKPSYVLSSMITVAPNGTDYRVDVQTTDGRTVTVSVP